LITLAARAAWVGGDYTVSDPAGETVANTSHS